MPKTCKKGYIRRRSRCVTRKLFVLKKGELTKFGYHADLSDAARHTALQKALDSAMPPLSLYRKLIAIYVLNKNRDKRRAKIYRADSEWVKKTPEYTVRA